MKAIQFTGPGGPEVVRFGEVAKPELKPDRVLIRVHATCANPADWKIREGTSLALSNLRYPMIPGWDASGVVVATGSHVQGVNVGAEVVGILPECGSYAEYALLSPAAMALRPASVPYLEAAAIPAAAVTAWTGLFTCGALRPGQRVLIHAAAGGVGHLAVQLARDAGAYVIGTASAAHHDFLKLLGADEVVDYRERLFETAVKDVDLVFDLVGGPVEARSWSVLKSGGTLVSAISPTPAAPVPHDKRRILVRAAATSADLETIMSLAGAGKLMPAVREVFPLSRAGEALELSRRGHGRGRIVIDIAGQTP